MSEKPALKVTSSFNPAVYNFTLLFQIGYDPSVNGGDSLYQRNPDYYAYKMQNVPLMKMNGIKNLLKNHGIDDYFIFQNGTSFRVHFKSARERGMAQAAMQPERGFMTEMYTCEAGTSHRQMKRLAQQFREEFKSMASGKRIRFVLDRERRTIRAVAKNGPDFIQFMRDCTTLENIAEELMKLAQS